MKPVILTDLEISGNLFPFAQVQPVAHIRAGILTIREKWEALLGSPVTLLQDIGDSDRNGAVLYAANIIPTARFIESLKKDGDKPDLEAVKIVQYPWQIFQLNDWALREDFRLITATRMSQPIPDRVQAINKEDIFIESGAVLNHCILNASTGPIYIGKNAEIMDGA